MASVWRTALELSGILTSQMRQSRAQQTLRFNSKTLRRPKEAMLHTSDSVRSTRTEDGRILLDIHHGRIFSLNVVGSRILELIEQGWNEALISEEISRAYAITTEVAGADVHDFLEALRKHRILQANDSGNSL